MSCKREDFDKIKNNPKNVSFNDLNKLLRDSGFTLRTQKSGTTHFTYKIKGCYELLTIPYARPVSKGYVKDALDLIQAYGNLDED